MARYDNNLVVIGGGSAGLIAAYIAATVRARVTLVQEGLMGGDCLNTGCVPSKTLIRSAAAAQAFRDAERFGVRAVEPEVDFPRVMARVREAIANIAPKDSMERYEALGVNCVAGRAMIRDPHHVAVGETLLSTRSIVLAAGASPVVPPIPGLDGVSTLTSETVWDLETLPGRLLVMGGGPIGCELAQSFQRLGSQVTLIDMADRLLPLEDPDVSELLQRRLRREGVEVRLEHRAESAEADGTGGGTLVARKDGALVRLPFDRILVAVGRRPNSRGYGLEELGVATLENGAVEVDRYLRTSVPNIYACGDLVGPYQFTHMASHQAWFAAVNALFGVFRRFAVRYDVVPWTTFTDPEVARVGLSETEARQRGKAVEVTLYALDDLDRAIAEDDVDGWVKVITPPGSDRILGATIVSRHAGELVTEFILAMTHGLGLKKLMSTVHVYPTMSESAKIAAGVWRRRHVPERLLGTVGWLHGLLR